LCRYDVVGLPYANPEEAELKARMQHLDASEAAERIDDDDAQGGAAQLLDSVQLLISVDPYHSLEAPAFNPRTCQVRNWFQSLLIKFDSYRYNKPCKRRHSRSSSRRNSRSSSSSSRRAVGLHTLNSIYPIASKAPGDPTLEPIK
jgi:hypothetical protein